MKTPVPTWKEAILFVLKQYGPLHYTKIADLIQQEGVYDFSGKTPGATIGSIVSRDIQKNREASPFIRLGKGIIGLKDTTIDMLENEAVDRLEPNTIDFTNSILSERDNTSSINDTCIIDDDKNEIHLVRVPLFPLYENVRTFLHVLPRFTRSEYFSFINCMKAQTGSPQHNVDWSNPDTWIPHRLEHTDRTLAEAIWHQSNKTLNPNNTRGSWYFVQQYNLLTNPENGPFCLTPDGNDFLLHSMGKVEQKLDHQEGLFFLLSTIAHKQPVSVSDLNVCWGEYLHQYSRFKSPNTVKNEQRYRLKNLLDRNLISSKKHFLSVTPQGLHYLQSFNTSSILFPSVDTSHKEDVTYSVESNLLDSIHRMEENVRSQLKELLSSIDPTRFEHLIGLLLKQMKYQNVIVTPQSGDGGVDIVADIELGITSVREVVQVKRHQRPIQRKDLDALRGSLHRFGAVRGTLITTSKFSSGTTTASIEAGAAPITLIDGDKLIDLLIEYSIGVQKRQIELLEIDTHFFSN